MLIMNKNRDSIINMETTDCIYIGADNHTIKAIVGSNGKMYNLGLYQTDDAAKIALEMLANAFKPDTMFFMPDDDAVDKVVRTRTVERPEKFAGNGKKPVRRGGS